MLLSMTLTTIIVGTTVGIIEFHGAISYWQYFNHALKISLIIEILGCFLIASTAIAALSKFLTQWLICNQFFRIHYKNISRVFD